MGLATGVEVKSEPVKTEDVVTAAPVEELKTVTPSVETTSAPSVTTSVEAPDAAEVTLCSLRVSEDRVLDFYYLFFLIFIFFLTSDFFFFYVF